MQAPPRKTATSRRAASGSGKAGGLAGSGDNLTQTEQGMLARLEHAGVIYWRGIKAQETRTLRRLVAKGLAVETADDRGFPAWREQAWKAAAPTSEPRAEARLFAHGALAELSAEILAWRRTGVLNGDQLRELAGILKGISPSDDALQQAERLVETLALELAASFKRTAIAGDATEATYLSNGEHAYPTRTVAGWPASKAARYVTRLYSQSALDAAADNVLRGRAMLHAESSRICASLASAARSGATDEVLGALARSELAKRGQGSYQLEPTRGRT